MGTLLNIKSSAVSNVEVTEIERGRLIIINKKQVWTASTFTTTGWGEQPSIWPRLETSTFKST
jgi:hypothetical protein